ncbi:MAG: leucine-rich repeat domain-containing protein [Bacteroidales bacterium]|nr:leucine-rich repeat domain-containing protein [Bacteroidales bacterium]
MKKLILMLMSLVSFMTHAYDFEVDGFYYETNLTNMTVTLVSGDVAYEGKVSIPSTVTYKNREFEVISIEGAFSDCENLQSVFIPASVMKLGDNSFMNCPKLNEISGMSGVALIGDNCFSNCTSLDNLSLPSTLRSIGKNAFSGCSELIQLDIPESVQEMGEYVFKDCHKMSNISLPNCLTNIPSGMCYGCRSLSQISLPSRIASIGDNAFKLCSAISSIEIPTTVNTIGDSSFSGCTSLTRIDFLDANSELQINGNSTAFIDCPINTLYLGRDIVYPRDPSNYGITQYYSPFEGKSSLKEVVIGSMVTNLYFYLFRNCSQLQSITIPSNVTYIYYGVFEDCTALTHLTIEDSEYELSFGGTDMNPLNIGILFFNDAPLHDVYIGRELRGKGDSRTGYSALYKQTGLKTITIGDFVKNINSLLYDESGSLSTTLARYSQLERLDVGPSLSILPDLSQNDNLQQLTIRRTIPPVANGFSNKQYMDLIPDIPSGSLDQYSTTGLWRNFWQFNENEGLISMFDAGGLRYHLKADNTLEVIAKDESYDGDIVIPAQTTYLGHPYPVTSIRNTAFANSAITSIFVSEKVTSIRDGSFYNCKQLKEVVFQGDLESIGSSAFKDCKSLSLCNIPMTVTSIGDYAFCNTGLIKVSIPVSVSSMGQGVFSDCALLESLDIQANIAALPNATVTNSSKLEEIILGNGITTIEEKAISNCTSLTSIEFPSSLKVVCSEAFQGCSSLSRIILNEGIEVLEDNAFHGLCSLYQLVLPASLQFVGSEAFNGCSSLKQVIIADSEIPLTLSSYSSWFDREQLKYEDMTYYFAAFWHGAFYCCPLEYIYIGRDLNYNHYTRTCSIYNDRDAVYHNKFDSPFYDITTIKKVEIGPLVKYLGDDTFDIPEINRKVSPDLFKGCVNIAEVISWAILPPKRVMFDYSVYDTANLLVPEEARSMYETTPGWEEFIKVNQNGIESVSTDFDSNQYIVHNLQGILVLKTQDQSQIQSLPNGIYIINGKKVLIQ